MSGIVLSNAVRENLLSLQNTATLLSSTQNKLATGLKVNSALDNANSFFTASSLNSRASDLGGLLDDQGQSIQILKAADEGIKGITKLVENAKAKANQASQTTDKEQRGVYSEEYNQLLGQIEELAKDASYNGKNLLAGTGNDVKVTFNEDSTASLTIKAVDYTDTTKTDGLSINDLSVTKTQVAATTATPAVQQVDFKGSLTIASGKNSSKFVKIESGSAKDSEIGGNFAKKFSAGDSIEIKVDDRVVDSLTITANTTYNDLVSKMNNINGISASHSGTTTTITSTLGTVTLGVQKGNNSNGNGILVKNVNEETAFKAGVPAKPAQAAHTSYAGGLTTDAGINTAVTQLNNALTTLRSQASTFGTNLTVVENRQNFTKAMINTLETGAGLLTLADTNKEGANLLALQTRQQLSSTALSFSSQADQAVLRLF